MHHVGQPFPKKLLEKKEAKARPKDADESSSAEDSEDALANIGWLP